MTPDLSIVMPTYNGTAYLAEQLDSILAQRFDRFELLIVDDGSSDATVATCEGYAARDPRIRLLPAAGNRGQTERLVELIAAAAAPLVAFSDQDDIWHPDKLALLVAALGDAALAFGTSELIDGTGAPLGRTLLDAHWPQPGPGDRLSYLFQPTVSAHAMVVRRERLSPAALRRLHWFDQLIGLDAMFSEGVRWVPEAITWHRIHAANQNNAVAAEAARWRRLAPSQLRASARWHGHYRWLFLQRLEHLGFSEHPGDTTRKLFHGLARSCTDAWFDPARGRRWSDAALNERLKTALAPLRGSEEDWHYATYQIDNLTRDKLHPRVLYRLGRDILKG